MAGGREAFVPLCRLYQLISQFGNRDDSIDEALALVTDAFEHAANSLKATIISAITSRPMMMSERAVTFIVDNVELLDPKDLQENATGLGTAIWAHQPETLVRLLQLPPPR